MTVSPTARQNTGVRNRHCANGKGMRPPCLSLTFRCLSTAFP